MDCRMPRGDVPFKLRFERGQWLETQPHTFTVFTIDGTAVAARAFALDERGAATPFGEEGNSGAPRNAAY